MALSREALPGIYRLVSSREGSNSQRLKDILRLAPNMHKHDGINTGTVFTSASLASHIAENTEIPRVITSFLGRHPIVVHVSSFSGESEIILQALNHSSIKARVDLNDRVRALDYRIGREPVRPMKPVDEQLLVHGLLECVDADLKSARDAWDKEAWSIKVPDNDALEAVRIGEKTFETLLATGRKPIEFPVPVKLRA
ncbi:MAG: hypothetical protein ACHQT7_02210 [Candidatus Levyibacteriota bacterium]